MNAASKDGAAVGFPPPLVPVVSLVVGALAQAFVRSLNLPWGGAFRYSAGVLLFVVAAAIMAKALRLFRDSGQDPKPWKATPEIIAEGVYRYTRNPMYLGMGLMQAAIAILLNNLWMLALVPVSWWVIYRIAIRHEEAYLEEKFGESYTRYKRSVRRWL